MCEISHQLFCKLQNHPTSEIKYIVLVTKNKSKHVDKQLSTQEILWNVL